MAEKRKKRKAIWKIARNTSFDKNNLNKQETEPTISYRNK